MNQTQRPRVMRKVILHAIWRQLITLATGMKQVLTLATVILNKKYWVTVPSLSLSRQWTRGFTKILQWLYWRHRLSWCMWLSNSLQTRRQAARGLTVICGELAVLAFMEAPDAKITMLLESNVLPTQSWLEYFSLPYPVASTGACRLKINSNPLPQDWEGTPKNWKLLLT